MSYFYTNLVELSRDIAHILSRDVNYIPSAQQRLVDYDNAFLTRTGYYGVNKAGDTEARLGDMAYGIYDLVARPTVVGSVRVDSDMLVECILLVFLAQADARGHVSFIENHRIDNTTHIPNTLVTWLWSIVFGRILVEKSVSVLEQVMDHGKLVNDRRHTALPASIVAIFKQSAGTAFAEYATAHFDFRVTNVYSAHIIAKRVLNVDILDSIATLLNARSPPSTNAQDDSDSGSGYQQLVISLLATTASQIGLYNNWFANFSQNYTGSLGFVAVTTVRACTTAIEKINRELAVLTAYIEVASTSSRAMIVVQRLAANLGAVRTRYEARRTQLGGSLS